MRYTDLMELGGDTAKKAEIRKRIGTVVSNALIAEFGEDFVRLLSNDLYVGETASKIPSGSIIADIGDIVDKDKMTKGALVQIEIKVKNWNDTRTAKTDRSAITLDDIDSAIEIANELAEKKAEDKKKKEEIKLKKISRDTKNRQAKE
jgi:hypothetical protein